MGNIPPSLNTALEKINGAGVGVGGTGVAVGGTGVGVTGVGVAVGGIGVAVGGGLVGTMVGIGIRAQALRAPVTRTKKMITPK
jgi:hypothetical protein